MTATAMTSLLPVQDRLDGFRLFGRNIAVGCVENDVENSVGEEAEHVRIKRGIARFNQKLAALPVALVIECAMILKLNDFIWLRERSSQRSVSGGTSSVQGLRTS
ncbi:hypothetical protein MZK49_19680 [Ensifer sesbaniae]|uniref:hypothetical protein n=1 Tax=Ensifer sesbaniae TaxID=1214071 RepID=UPI002001D3A7|nr:hypothetical protein [Ensifer sesbaniae]